MASRSADHTEIASMNGGSPTALDKYTLSSSLGRSNSATRKSSGVSLTAGIL